MDTHDVVCTYNGLLLSYKKERIPSAAMWMRLGLITLSHKERDKYHMISLISGT